MFIRLSLGCIASAFFVLLSSKLLLWQAVPLLPEFVSRLGISLLLLGFGILLLGGLWLLSRLVYVSCSDYFSASQRHLRRLLFAANQQNNLKQRFYFQKLKIAINTDIKRQRLLSLDNRRQIKALAKDINSELMIVKPYLSKDTYRQIQQTLKQACQQQNIDALLALKQTIAQRGRQ